MGLVTQKLVVHRNVDMLHKYNHEYKHKSTGRLGAQQTVTVKRWRYAEEE